jgi:hypothetical protein
MRSPSLRSGILGQMLRGSALASIARFKARLNTKFIAEPYLESSEFLCPTCVL